MRLLCTGLLACVMPLAMAQTLDLSVTVHDLRGNPLSGARVAFIRQSDNFRLEKITTSSGELKIRLESPGLWDMSINGMVVVHNIDVPSDGSGEMSFSETFDMDRAKILAAQLYNRDGFTSQPSAYIDKKRPPQDEGVVQVNVVDRGDRPQAGVNVALVDTKNKQIWRAVTDSKGNARFWGKMGKTYDIDVAGVLNIGYVTFLTTQDVLLTETVQYEPVRFTERNHQDTITQQLNGQTDPPSGHQYFQLTVIRDGAPATGEPVYLAQIHSSRVYSAVTDKNGVASFMLPFQHKYLVHFYFQRDVDVVDLTDAFGRSGGAMQLTYIPDPRLEHPELFIPGPEELFLNDFRNFLTRQEKKPTGKIGIQLEWGGPVNGLSKEAVLRIDVQGGQPSGTLPLNVAFVIDRSGSMAGYDRIEQLKTSMTRLIAQLPDNATLSLIGYSDEMNIILPPTQLGRSRNSMLELIHNIQPGGGTNMLEAMKTGYGFVKQNYSTRKVNKVVLMTDGYDANEIGVLEAAQKEFSGIECSAVGIGEGFNYALLQLLAQNGKGQLYQVNSKNSFESAFTPGMAGVAPVAVNASVTIQFPKRLLFRHLFGYAPDAVSEGGPVTYTLPNLYQGSNEVALAKFDLLTPDATIEKEPVTVTVRYTDPFTGKAETQTEKIYLDWNEYTGELELLAENEMKKLYAIAIMNQAIKVMADQYAAGNTKEAQAVLQRTREQVVKLYPQANDEDVKKLMGSLDNYLQAFRNLSRVKGGKS